MRSLLKWASTALLASHAAGITVDVSDPNQIKSATSTIAYGMMKYYTGNNTGDTPGNLPDPYYWWEAGAMFMNMIEYWYCKLPWPPLDLIPETARLTYHDIQIPEIQHTTML
jgi:mannan endo-1,6-alpha-mannosidase